MAELLVLLPPERAGRESAGGGESVSGSFFAGRSMVDDGILGERKRGQHCMGEKIRAMVLLPALLALHLIRGEYGKSSW